MQKKPKNKAARTAPFSSWHIILIIVLSFITYSNALAGNFVWDDELQIVKNWQIRDVRHVGLAFSSAFWAFAGPETGRTNFCRPVQTLTYMLAYLIGGLSAWSYHFVNVLFHTSASIILYLICIEYGISSVASLLACALFVTHPIHTEAVTWNAGTPDVSCGMFYFASIFLFLRYLISGRKKWLWLAALAFLVACFSKEMAITMPIVAVLLLLAKGQLRQGRFRKALNDLAPLFAAGLVYIGARLAALRFLSTTHLNIETGVLDWATLGLRVFGQYIHYALLPYPLSAYHLIPLHLPDRVLSTLLYTGCIAVTALIVFMANQRVGGIGVWSIIFAVTLIPVFNFKGISQTFFAERYLYIPTMALSVVLALLLNKARNHAKIVTAAVVFVFAVLTFVRNADWQSDEKIYESILRVQPEVAHVRNNLADIYIKRGDDTRAESYLETALQYLESNVYVQSDWERYRGHVGLGAIAARGQKYVEARQHLNKALELYPRGDWAYLYLGGVIMEEDGDYASAIEYFKKAIDLGPLNEVARDYMGIALFNMKRYQEAARYFREALEINPTYKDAETHLAMATRALAS